MKLKVECKKLIENVIFDFGNVILDIDISLAVKAFKDLGIEGFSVEDIHPNTKDFFLALELGTITDEQFLEQLRAAYPSANGVSDQEIWDAWNILLLEYVPKRIELLKKVRENYNIYLLSNTNHPHRLYFLEKFRKEFGFELESLFVKCYYSDEMNLRKPDARIYRSVVEDAEIVAENSLFIDDNLCNFSGAEEVGLNWYHLTGAETILDLFE